MLKMHFTCDIVMHISYGNRALPYVGKLSKFLIFARGFHFKEREHIFTFVISHAEMKQKIASTLIYTLPTFAFISDNDLAFLMHDDDARLFSVRKLAFQALWQSCVLSLCLYYIGNRGITASIHRDIVSFFSDGLINMTPPKTH